MRQSGLPLPGSPLFNPTPLPGAGTSPPFSPATPPFFQLNGSPGLPQSASTSPSAYALSRLVGHGGGSPIGGSLVPPSYGGGFPADASLSSWSPFGTETPIFHNLLPAEIKALPQGTPEPGTSRASSPGSISPSLAPPRLAPSPEKLYTELKNIDNSIEEILYDTITGGRMAPLSQDQINVIRVSLDVDQEHELKEVEDTTPGITFVGALYEASTGNNAHLVRLSDSQILSILRLLTPEQAAAVYAEVRMHASE